MKEFTNPQQEKLTEQAFLKSMTLSVCKIIVCMIALCVVTWTWFNANTSTPTVSIAACSTVSCRDAENFSINTRDSLASDIVREMPPSIQYDFIIRI